MSARLAAASRVADSVLETAHRLPSGDGWLLSGRTPQAWAENEPAGELYATLTVGRVTGQAHTAFFAGAETSAAELGFVTVLRSPCPAALHLLSLEIPRLGLRFALGEHDTPISVHAVAARHRRLIRTQYPGPGHPVLDLLPRPPFDRTDTIAALWPPVHIELDSAIRVPPHGLAVTGWYCDPSDSVVALRIRCGSKVASLDPARWVSLRRPDVMEPLRNRYGLENDRIGLIAYAPEVGITATETYLEVETTDGAIAYKPIRVLDRAGLGVIKQFLSLPPLSGARLQPSFDDVLGPIVAGLNAARLSRPRRRAELAYGGSLPAPQTSVVIPLHGRLDFMEYQLALFSERPDPATELLYVLDDPTLQDDAERLAGSCWARFRLPFRLITLAENWGYAPASNVGLQAAAGEYICLLNSDVFPAGDDGLSWVPALTARLASDPSLGVVAPLLLYDDGTVQHGGMHYERLPSFANWAFPIHTAKGAPPPDGRGLRAVDAVSGACIVMRRQDLLACGGLDESYLVGDFEDSDLSQRLRASGQRCAVDLSRRLYHLERQSQAEGQSWRVNATLYNAWRHERRWGAGLHVAP